MCNCKIIHLTKAGTFSDNPSMDSNYIFFLGLAAATTLRKSFLMLASNFLVGTFLISFFLPSSIGGLL